MKTFVGGLRGFGQALTAGCVASVGVAGAGVVVGLVARRPLPVASTWALLISGTGILIVAGLLLLGRMPAADRKQKHASPLAHLKQAAREATSPERESATDTGFRLFVVGATVLAWGFVASAVFQV